MILSDEKKKEITRLYTEGYGAGTISVRLRLPQSWIRKFIESSLEKRNQEQAKNVRVWRDERERIPK